ncbi:MAG: 1,2-dihydroxy-3-keto-5-methylthiopentene dioxygenase [Pyrinomonadaceae bacterium]
MAVVRILGEDVTLCEDAAIRRHLAGIGISYERWETTHAVSDDATAGEILAAYAEEIENLKARGGYVTADMIDVYPETPGLEEMLAKFRREHWHDEDEVRFVVSGRGVFHLNPAQGPLTSVETGPGDLISVPSGTRHWFDLCADRRIRAIRLFREPAGWVPRYTDSGAEQSYQPICLGPVYLPLPDAAR